MENLIKIEGIEEDTAKALIERAKEFYQKDQEDISQRIKDLGLADDLIMSARSIVYKDWEMINGEQKNKTYNFGKSQKVN